MIRRHFFLFAAILVLVVMVAAGGLKVFTKKAGAAGPGGPALTRAGASTPVKRTLRPNASPWPFKASSAAACPSA